MKKVKICGLWRPVDIEAVNIAKPEYCGFVIDFPQSRRSVSPQKVKILCGDLNSDITPVGVFVDKPPEVVAELLNSGVVSVAQLHGKESEKYIAVLRGLTDRPIWQAFQIRSRLDVEHAAKSASDFVLLDAGQGTGKRFDWDLLIGFPRAFGLAGGLRAENLPDALNTQASLLDVSGGVETDGVKDAGKIKKFVDIIRC